jgi:hypothetical protein
MKMGILLLIGVSALAAVLVFSGPRKRGDPALQKTSTAPERVEAISNNPAQTPADRVAAGHAE